MKASIIMEKLTRAIAYLSVILVLLVTAFVALLADQVSCREWARTAPTVKVTVESGDTGWSLIKEQLPANLRQTESIGQLLDDISSRTGENLIVINAGETLHLPIPYEEWVAKR